ncbi:hypothetical protein C2S51_024249 [Perilla frutescens var. frutescens]|nr:hypothetical protein C2S51_024249 [Perilla frutescens var. frutescens]
MNNLYLRFPGLHPVVAGSCNGLLCLEYPDCKYVLWNPLTDDYKFLPPLDFKLPPCTHEKYKDTECTTSVRSSFHGLGFHGDDYKFEIPHPGEYIYNRGCLMATSFDGFCYWKSLSGGGDEGIYIVSFDIANEKFSILPYPDIMIVNGPGHYDHLLIEFDGLLGIVIYPIMGAVKLFNFWVMEDNGGAGGGVWTRKIKFDVRLVGAGRPLGFCRNGASFLFQGIDGKLMEYDYIARKLNKFNQVYDYSYAMQVFSYIESTVTFVATDTLLMESKAPGETEQVMEPETKKTERS